MSKRYKSTLAKDVYEAILSKPGYYSNNVLASVLGLGDQTVRQITSNLRSLGLIEIESRGVPCRMGCFGFLRPTSARIMEDFR